jgi:hypothetical protein
MQRRVQNDIGELGTKRRKYPQETAQSNPELLYHAAAICGAN